MPKENQPLLPDAFEPTNTAIKYLKPRKSPSYKKTSKGKRRTKDFDILNYEDN